MGAVTRLIDDIDVLGSKGLPREDFFAEVSARVRTVIDNDAGCWHTLDPSTRLLTSDAPRELVERGVLTAEAAPAAGELIVRSEYMVEDVNTFAGLATRRVPVGILDHATRGNPESSARYRDVLLPADIPHELRGAFVIRGRVWGAVHLARRAAGGPFQPRDAEILAALTGSIARGIRASLRFDAARRITGADAPGMVVLGPRDEVELITPPAREMLAALRPAGGRYTDETVATPVLALAAFVRSAPDGGKSGGNVVTVPARDGWLTLHASLPGSPEDGRVAVVLERAGGARSATVRLEAFGATAREREVATLLARGLSRAEIAEALVVSPHTVEDHVRNLYEKVGVTSRQELVARVFLDEYLPEVVRQTPLTSRGRFDLA
ncbi:helix-turn-helix transcriptional regulator [Paraconexibacter antarcticus]|uniref:Helix-turn-helix transcriptional regulator n=1 Tax=Paraconexibacter antarcticus TaxID=2949664 RepID=A0ABY5DYI8_9ACTN|nr:helix-turn-helix transcriptional regulator [Paraconexibacter antarcticus]UTI65887.1 helix-turn-helix transcriptional regulator [Paraconexibacter antarcticus]